MYKLHISGAITRLSDGLNIPSDPANRDFIAYTAWVDAGGITLPADPAPDTHRDDTIADIRALESQQARAVRECLLAMAQSGVSLPPDAAARLTDIDAQIAVLRAQLAVS